MTGKLDAVMVPLAKNLISDFGATVTYTQTTETFDPGTGKTSVTEVASSVIITPPEPYKTGRINETTIQTGDMMSSIAAAGISFVPVIGDKVLFAGAEWQLVGIDPVYSGELPAMYNLQLRR